MGARGPAPKPTALRVLEGNPGHRKINHQEPKPRPIAPKCPDFLDAEAKREWRRLVSALMRIGVLTEVDTFVLAGCCQSWSDYRSARMVLNEKGMTMETEYGPRARPEVKIARDSLAQMHQLGAQLGLSPSARGRMVVPGQKADDGWGDLLD